jgi:hypothetical protein
VFGEGPADFLSFRFVSVMYVNIVTLPKFYTAIQGTYPAPAGARKARDGAVDCLTQAGVQDSGCRLSRALCRPIRCPAALLLASVQTSVQTSVGVSQRRLKPYSYVLLRINPSRSGNPAKKKLWNDRCRMLEWSQYYPDLMRSPVFSSGGADMCLCLGHGRSGARHVHAALSGA